LTSRLLHRSVIEFATFILYVTLDLPLNRWKTLLSGSLSISRCVLRRIH